MRRFIALFAPTCGFLLLVAGMALAVNKMCAGDCRGTDGRDRLVGSARTNTIHAEGGNDRVIGRGGDDGLKGGGERDDLFGGEGNDRLKGGAGSDEIRGGLGDDLLRAGGSERPNDGARDVLDCGDGNDTAYFVQGQDTVSNCEVLNPPDGSLGAREGG